MAIFTTSWALDLATLSVTFITVLYLYFRSIFTYWSKRGVPTLTPSFPFGNLTDMFLVRRPIGDIYRDLYLKLDGHPLVGVYQAYMPSLLLRDPELIKLIYVKDAALFQDRGMYHDEENDPIMNHLFAMSGPKWKFLRAKLTPTFTSGKMKMMFHALSDICVDLKKSLEEAAKTSGDSLEVNDILARFTTDVIASVAFGIQCNCLADPQAEFRTRGRQFFQRGFLGNLGFLFTLFAPKLAAITKWGNTPKAITDFFTNAVKETVTFRESNNVTRSDFMQMMIQLKNQGYVEGDKNWAAESANKIDMKDVAAQAFVFYLAGFETSSTTLTFALYELALNQDIQRRLRAEVDEALTKMPDGKITYEAMEEMEYLTMVISETLRKYPPLNFLNRECNTSYPLPGTDLVIERGTQTIVSVLGIHQNPEFYPEPERFDPERFTKEARTKRNPYTYLPFGTGPRNCIGSRFGLMQTKVGLITLLRHFEFSRSAKTAVPLVFDPSTAIMTSKDGMQLCVKTRKL